MALTRTVRVVIEKEIEIILPDEFLTPEYLLEYRQCMNEDATLETIFKDAAYIVALGVAEHNNDGFGRMLVKSMSAKYIPPPQTVHNTVRYSESFEDTEITLVEED